GLESDSPAEGSRLSVTSDLRGVEIDLPAPYGKAPDQPRRFWLEQPLNGAVSTLAMGLGDQAELQLRFEQNTLASGLLMLGETQRLAHYPGLFLVTGQIDHLALDAWRPVLSRYRERADAMAGAASEAGDGELMLAASQLRIDTFEGFSQRINDSLLDLRQRPDSWWLSVVSPRFDGEMLIPDAGAGPLNVRLDRLQLPATTVTTPGEGDVAESPLETFDLTALSRFSAYVAIADLHIGDERYGSLNFELRTEPGRLQLANLGGYVRDIRIGVDQPAYFEWVQSEDTSFSRLTGDFDFANVGRVLEQWHYERFVESSYGQGAVDLRWPGGPQQWQLKRSDGSLSLLLKDGRFLKASQTTEGTLKAVGIVNLMNVVRRLRLDFTDLYEKGISYDRVEGEARLAEGRLNIADNLVVDSPSSRFRLRGNADLRRKVL
ncbi:MAG: hypothetical protein GWN87_09150, partial [Desulfuromonadales bacterium]|nr:hypothetical protein [Desulfuromonadales bacterium]